MKDQYMWETLGKQSGVRWYCTT